jgi:hypothetical protein
MINHAKLEACTLQCLLQEANELGDVPHVHLKASNLEALQVVVSGGTHGCHLLQDLERGILALVPQLKINRLYPRP